MIYACVFCFFCLAGFLSVGKHRGKRFLNSSCVLTDLKFGMFAVWFLPAA